MVDASVSRLEDGAVELSVTVPLEDVEKQLKLTYRELANSRSFPGFRKGKTPREVIDKLVGREAVYAHTLQDLLPKAYSDALDKANVTPLGQPEFDPFPTLEENKPLEFKAKVEALPEIIVDTGNLDAVREPVPEADSEQVEKTLQSIRRESVKFSDPEEGDACGDLDQAVLDYDISLVGEEDGGPFETRQDFEIQLGVGQMIEELESHVKGMKAGEEKKADVKFPEEFSNEKLKGKWTSVRFALKSFKKACLPEMNDEWAQSVSGGKCAALEAFREEIGKRIKARQEELQEMAFELKIIARLVEGTRLEVPAKMADEEVDERLHSLSHRLEDSGVEIEDYLEERRKTMSQLREEIRTEVEKELKSRFVIDAAFRKEGLTIDRRDFADAMIHFARQRGLTATQLKKLNQDEEFSDQIRRQIKRRKLVNALKARIETAGGVG